MYKKILTLVMALAMVLLAASGCTGGSKTDTSSAGTEAQNRTQTQKTENTAPQILKFGVSSEPNSLEPVLGMGITQRTIKMSMYRGLLNYNADGVLQNELAESYQVSDDKLTYTFSLRDAKFHNGDPVTAQDVKFTFERILDPENSASYRTELSIIDSVEAVDEKTVKIKLKSVSASFAHYLALPESVILSEAYTKANDITKSPMGAGPFKFASWDKGQNLTVEKFDGYYKEGYPLLDEVKFMFFTDEEARSNALKTGDVDIAELIPWKDMAAVESSPDLKLDSINGPYMVINFNCEEGPFADARVRQAVSYAIDRKAVYNTAFSGRGAEIYGFVIQKGLLGYNSETDNYFSHDPEKAKELLKEAGYPEGFSAKLLSTSTYAMHQQTAVAVQSELAKVGIDLTLDLPDWATRQSRVAKGDYEIVVNGTGGDILDPDWLTNYFYGGQVTLNKSVGFDNARINALLDEGRVTLDEAKRQEIYAEVSMLIMEESPAVFLTWREQGYAMRKNVNGYKNPAGFLTQSQGGIPLETTYLE